MTDIDEGNFYQSIKARSDHFQPRTELMREIDRQALEESSLRTPPPDVQPARLTFNDPSEVQGMLPPEGSEFSIVPESLTTQKSPTGRQFIIGTDGQGNEINLGYIAQNPQSPQGAPNADSTGRKIGEVDPNAQDDVGVLNTEGASQAVAQGKQSFQDVGTGAVKGLFLGLSEAGGAVARAAGISEELEEFGAFAENTFGIPRTINTSVEGGAEMVGETIGRFMSVGLPAARAAKMVGAGLFVRSMVGELAGDFAAFPEDDPNLADVAKEFKGVKKETMREVRDLYIDVLSKDFSQGGDLLEGEFEARMKNSFANIIPTAAIGSSVFMYRMVRRAMAQPGNLQGMLRRGMAGERKLEELSKNRLVGLGAQTQDQIAMQETEAMNDILIGQIGAMADDLQGPINKVIEKLSELK